MILLIILYYEIKYILEIQGIKKHPMASCFNKVYMSFLFLKYYLNRCRIWGVKFTKNDNLTSPQYFLYQTFEDKTEGKCMEYKHSLPRKYFLLMRILIVFVIKITPWEKCEENTAKKIHLLCCYMYYNRNTEFRQTVLILINLFLR